MRVQMILEAIDRASRPIKAVMNSLLGVERASKAASGVAKIGQGLYSIGTRVGAMATISSGAAIGLATSMLDTASAFETMEATLRTTEGGHEKARKAMSWVSDFAAKTPYELADVTEAFVRLRSQGLDPTNGLMKTLGDASSAMGKPLMQAVEAIADAKTGENERLKEFGITASMARAADAVTYSYTDLAGKTHEVTAKLSDQADIVEKLSGILNSKFAGAMDEQATTWKNIVSNLKDAWTRFQLAIMQSGLFDWMKSKATGLLDTVNKMAADGRLAALAKEIGETIKKVLIFTYDMAVGIADAVSTITPYITGFVEMVGGAKNAMMLLGGAMILGPILKIASGIGMVISAFTPLAPVLMIAARAFMALGMAIMTTPVGWIIAAIAAIAAGAYLIYDNWAQIGPWLASLWASIKNAMAAAWNGMVSWLAGIGGRMMASLKSGWASLTGWLSGIGAGITQALSNAWATVSDWFTSNHWPEFPAFLSLNNVLATLGTIGADITASLSAAWATVSNWFTAAAWPKLKAITILDDLTAALGPVQQWIETWGKAIYGAFETAINKVSDFINGAATKIGDAFKTVTDALSSVSAYVGISDPAAPPLPAAPPVSTAPTAISVVASAAEIDRVSASAQAATDMVNAIPAAAVVAVAGANAVLSAVSFYSHGVAMMTTLATGIRAGAASAVAAARETVQQIRDHLPHSPAKTGPLSDLDKVQFSQTLATAINAGAPRAVMAVRALSAVMAAAIPASHAYAVNGTGTFAAAPAPVKFARADAIPTSPKGGNAPSGGGAPTFHVAINVTNAGGDDVVGKIRQSAYEVAEILRSEWSRRERVQH